MHLRLKWGGYRIAWLLEVICACAVDAFVIISGYMSYGKAPRYFKIVNLWFQVFFYSCIVTLILSIIGINVEIEIKEIIKMSMPVLFNRYWFFTSYFALFLAMPLLNRIFYHIDEISARKILVVIVFLFSVMSFITDPFEINYGYSFIWFVMLYCIGALSKCCHLFENKSNTVLLIYLLVSILITWLVKILTGSRMLIEYNSPTILFNGLLLVILFSRFNFKGTIISKLSPLAFGIYLLHDHPVVREELITGSMAWIVNKDVLFGIGIVLGFALMLFIAGLIVDCIRLQLFRFLHIKDLSEKIANWLSKMLDILCRVVKKIC